MDSNEIVLKIRNQLIAEIEKNPQLYEENAKEWINNDWYIIRNLNYNKNDEKAVHKSLIETLQWRKTYGVSKLTELYFPKEFYESGGTEIYQINDSGDKMLLLRLKTYRKMPPLFELLKQYIVYKIDKIDHKSTKRWIIMIDYTDTSLKNLDMEFTNFLTKTLYHHYAGGFNGWNYRFPEFFKPSWKVIKHLIRKDERKEIKFIKKDELFNYVEPQYMPTHIEGKGKDMREVPNGAVSFTESKHLDLSEKQIEKLLKTYGKIKKAIGIE